jgi:hypothetical protein
MGDPNYVQILYNENQNMIALMPAGMDAEGALSIRQGKTTKRINERGLVRFLCKKMGMECPTAGKPILLDGQRRADGKAWLFPCGGTAPKPEEGEGDK